MRVEVSMYMCMCVCAGRDIGGMEYIRVRVCVRGREPPAYCMIR